MGQLSSSKRPPLREDSKPSSGRWAGTRQRSPVSVACHAAGATTFIRVQTPFNHQRQSLQEGAVHEDSCSSYASTSPEDSC